MPLPGTWRAWVVLSAEMRPADTVSVTLLPRAMGSTLTRGGGWRRAGAGLAGALTLAVAAGCGINGGDDDAGQAPMSDSRCSPASVAVFETISEGLDTGLSLIDAAIVKSEDYTSAYFVSARIVGASGEPIATWVVTDPEEVGDLVFSVTEPAKRNSDFSTANNSFSGSDDGVAESQECAEIE